MRGDGLGAFVPAVFLVVEDAVAVDYPAYIARAVSADGEWGVGILCCASHCCAGLENAIE